MSILNRINRIIKERKKKACKAYIKRMGVLAEKHNPTAQRSRIKNRGHDGTMYGPFRSRQGG